MAAALISRHEYVLVSNVREPLKGRREDHEQNRSRRSLPKLSVISISMTTKHSGAGGGRSVQQEKDLHFEGKGCGFVSS